MDEELQFIGSESGKQQYDTTRPSANVPTMFAHSLCTGLILVRSRGAKSTAERPLICETGWVSPHWALLTSVTILSHLVNLVNLNHPLRELHKHIGGGTVAVNCVNTYSQGTSLTLYWPSWRPKHVAGQQEWVEMTRKHVQGMHQGQSTFEDYARRMAKLSHCQSDTKSKCRLNTS